MTKPQRVIVIYAKKDDEYNNNPNHFIIHRRSCLVSRSFLIIAKELSLSPKSNGHNLIKKKQW